MMSLVSDTAEELRRYVKESPEIWGENFTEWTAEDFIDHLSDFLNEVEQRVLAKFPSYERDTWWAAAIDDIKAAFREMRDE